MLTLTLTLIGGGRNVRDEMSIRQEELDFLYRIGCEVHVPALAVWEILQAHNLLRSEERLISASGTAGTCALDHERPDKPLLRHLVMMGWQGGNPPSTCSVAFL